MRATLIFALRSFRRVGIYFSIRQFKIESRMLKIINNVRVFD
jgi:hypothetical protein